MSNQPEEGVPISAICKSLYTKTSARTDPIYYKRIELTIS